MREPKISSIDSGKGLLMIFSHGVYSFQCIPQSQCFWKTEEYELQFGGIYHVMMSVPTSLISNCECELDATQCGCKDPVPIKECKECADGFFGLTNSGCICK